MQKRLGLGLKTMYKNVLDEPLPDNMLELLNQFDDDCGSGQADTADCQSSPRKGSDGQSGGFIGNTDGKISGRKHD
mgnify:CR=1 FL=1